MSKCWVILYHILLQQFSWPLTWPFHGAWAHVSQSLPAKSNNSTFSHSTNNWSYNKLGFGTLPCNQKLYNKIVRLLHRMVLYNTRSESMFPNKTYLHFWLQRNMQVFVELWVLYDHQIIASAIFILKIRIPLRCIYSPQPTEMFFHFYGKMEFLRRPCLEEYIDVRTFNLKILFEPVTRVY